MVNHYMFTPPRVSPLAGHIAGGAQTIMRKDLQISLRHDLTIIQVMTYMDQLNAVTKQVKKEFGLEPNSKPLSAVDQQDHNKAVLWQSPLDWLLVTSYDTELFSRLRNAITDDMASVVDQSHGRSCVRLAGINARELLSHGSLMDTSKEGLLVGTCVGTSFFHLAAHIHAISDTCFDIYVSRSFALHLWEAMEHASHHLR